MKSLLAVLLVFLCGMLTAAWLAAHDGPAQAQQLRPFGAIQSGDYCVFWTKEGGIAAAPIKIGLGTAGYYILECK